MNNTKLVIPSCNDFMSIYGFDSEMDDVIQILKFVHGDERVNLSFDITVNSVRLLFYRNDTLVFDLYREDLLELYLDENGDSLSFKLSDNFVITINFYPEISIFVTCPYADIHKVSSETKHIIVTAQHLDGIDCGRGMGAVLPASLYNAGVRATFLNHAEHPLTISQVVASINQAEKLGLITILCADSIKEARMLAMLNPTIMLCEPTELIGTGQTSDDSYILETNHQVKSVNSDILMMQGAGIMNEKDVYRTIKLGAEGTGCTSGIVKAENPKEMLRLMVEAIDQVMNEG